MASATISKFIVVLVTQPVKAMFADHKPVTHHANFPTGSYLYQVVIVTESGREQ